MQLRPFYATVPADSRAAEAMARLDWPCAGHTDARGELSKLGQKGDALEIERPSILAYRLRRSGHDDAWGLLGVVPCSEYRTGELLIHEQTLVKTVETRTRYLESASLQSGPVLLADSGEAVRQALELARSSVSDETPLTEIIGAGRSDTLWALPENVTTSIQALLAKAERPLVADGHHRAKATAAACDDMLVALFDENDFTVGACERKLSGAPHRALLSSALGEHGISATPSDAETPEARHAKLYDGQSWCNLDLGDADELTSDSRLLQDRVLSPVFGVADPTTDERLECLPACAAADQAAALAGPDEIVLRLHPAGLSNVRAMAESGILMPPKTTWFEPKPLPGLVIRTL